MVIPMLANGSTLRFATSHRARSYSRAGHAARANDLHDAEGRLVATEFGATAITSPSYGSLLPGLGEALMAVNPEVVFCDQDRKGYTVLTLTRTEAIAEFITVSTIMAKSFERAVAAQFQVAPGQLRQPLVKAGQA